MIQASDDDILERDGDFLKKVNRLKMDIVKIYVEKLKDLEQHKNQHISFPLYIKMKANDGSMGEGGIYSYHYMVYINHHYWNWGPGQRENHLVNHINSTMAEIFKYANDVDADLSTATVKSSQTGPSH